MTRKLPQALAQAPVERGKRPQYDEGRWRTRDPRVQSRTGKLELNRAAPKLSDVARVAGVSLATASRALSASEQVRPETLERVRDAVRMLGYVAHGAARALASRRTHTVGAVIPTLDNAIFANSVNALQTMLNEGGFTLLLASHGYDLKVEVQVTKALVERGVDGLVLVGTDHDHELYQLVNALKIPYVLTWSLDDSGRHPCIGFDNREAAIQVTRFLLDLGHREFGVISGHTMNNDRARNRVAGVRDALEAHGLSLPQSRIVEKAYSLTSGREGLRQLMAGPRRPTAVICINDVLAIGAVIECEALGLSVPGDVSITGFDDMEIAAHVGPGITTIHLPTAELGRAAANHIISRLAEGDVPRCTKLPVELIVRGSTAAPAAGGGKMARKSRKARG